MPKPKKDETLVIVTWQKESKRAVQSSDSLTGCGSSQLSGAASTLERENCLIVADRALLSLIKGDLRQQAPLPSAQRGVAEVVDCRTAVEL